MEIHEHNSVGDKQLRQPFYYKRWFRCTNKSCKTTLVMPERYKVRPEPREIGRLLCGNPPVLGCCNFGASAELTERHDLPSGGLPVFSGSVGRRDGTALAL
jgi:hypothetical protein